MGAAWLSGQAVFLSPDETANAFFAKSFAAGNGLSIPEPLNIPLRGLIHPRSIVSVAGNLVPGGFVGWPVILGFLAFLFGFTILPFIVPMFAALAVFAVYAILCRLGSEHFAILSAALLAIHPAWWYYASRGFMPNVLFVSLAVFAVFILVTRPFRLTRFSAELNLIFAGACLGLALFVRPSEVFLIVAAFAFGTWMFCQKAAWRSILIFCAASLVAFSPFFFFNAKLYGSPFTTGYTYRVTAVFSPFQGGIERGLPATPTFSASLLLRDRIERFLLPVFPFGTHPRAAARVWAANAVDLYPWISALAFLGLFASQFRKDRSDDERKRWGKFFWIAAFVSVWLTVMYGSWTFHDNPDPSIITIGNSYARYWLPMFLLWTPFVARGFLFVVEWFPNRSRSFVVWCLFLVCVVLSARTAVFAKGDGLLDASATLQQSSVVRDYAFSRTESDAVIVVDRADKIFFPTRRVIYPLRNETTYAAMPEIARVAPLYYYGISFPPQDMEYLNQEKLAGLGLKIEKVETFGIESLYRISQRR